MRLRPRRGNLVIWSSSGVPDGGSWAWRPARPRRIRWWLRTGTLLALIAVVRLARTARTRWEPVSGCGRHARGDRLRAARRLVGVPVRPAGPGGHPAQGNPDQGPRGGPGGRLLAMAGLSRAAG